MEAVTLSLGKNTMRWMKINSLKKIKYGLCFCLAFLGLQNRTRVAKMVSVKFPFF